MSMRHSRRYFLRILIPAGLGVPMIARAARETETLEILVDRDDWGSASPSDVRMVITAAAGEIWRHCAGQLMRPIRVYHREDVPLTDFLHDWRGRVRIGIASEDTRWAQMAFQFGHEFCHALAQHSAAAKRSWHPPRHANLWLEECLCEVGSLFVLRRLAAAWQHSPPHPQWRTYAPAFGEYATVRLDRPDHQLPAGATFRDWFRKNEPELRENHSLRARNVIVARQMLPIFEADPGSFEALCYLNLGQRKQGKPLAEHMAEWRAAVPPELRPFVERISGVFT